MATTQNLKIVAYLKPMCGWSQGVRAIFKKYNITYEEKDIINDPSSYEEMVKKSGQQLSPCVEINGQMLADVSGDEVEAWMLKKGIVQKAATKADAPTDRGCADHQEPIDFEGHFRGN
ncbi:MAG: glutaredoxin [Candidatus Omnitrophica bacterium]|nr:glutaredoxin [Candidatus Omnitrophota bacterium]